VLYSRPNQDQPPEAEAIVQELLSRGGAASLRAVNKATGTPLELACELGKTRLAGLMLRRLAEAGQLESAGPDCMHLAAKNGHNDLIRLLLLHGAADLDRLSERCQGSPLHEACRHGRLATAKLLLECGADPGLSNQLDQQPRDVVRRQQGVEADIKCLLGQFAQQATARALCPHQGGAGALSFDAGELLVVLERPPVAASADEVYSSLGVSGGACLWRGFILDRATFTARSGYFPASHVQLLSAGPACVLALMRQGLSDSQIIFAWLADSRMQHYYQHFVQAGYDLLTVLRATPADLSAIGILEPSHRLQIKQSMASLDVSGLDLQLGRLLATVASVEQLLQLVHLEQYSAALTGHCRSLDEFASGLSWEDLEELGVRKLGHQKKLLLVAKRLREVLAHKRQHSSSQSGQTWPVSKSKFQVS